VVDEQTTIPRDEFSTALRKLSTNPGAVRKQTVIDLEDFYGNLVTWIVTTFRADGSDTVLLQRNVAQGAGDRLVLPPPVMAAIIRQRDGAVAVNRRRGARAAAATREAKGIKPAFGRKGAKA
jgi:hypothetical protein